MSRSLTILGPRAGLLLLLVLFLAGCARPIIWERRDGSESSHDIPTCWNCQSVVEFETDECIRCGEKYRWISRPGEEE